MHEHALSHAGLSVSNALPDKAPACRVTFYGLQNFTHSWLLLSTFSIWNVITMTMMKLTHDDDCYLHRPRWCRQWAWARHCWQREMAVRQRDGGKLIGCSTCAVLLNTARSSDVSPADVHTTLLAAGCSGSGKVPYTEQQHSAHTHTHTHIHRRYAVAFDDLYTMQNSL